MSLGPRHHDDTTCPHLMEAALLTTLSKRALAVKTGAVELTSRQMLLTVMRPKRTGGGR